LGKDDWDKWPNGDIAVHPVTRWHTAIFMQGKAGALRLEYALDQTLKQFGATQLVLTSALLRELAGVLVTLANAMDEVAKETPKKRLN